MADIRVTHEGGAGLPDGDPTLVSGAAVPVAARPVTDPDHLLPEHAGAGTPGMVAATDDPDTVRTEIEQTRARMSSTIDQLESALLRKKERIEERLDVAAPVRQRPLAYVGGVFAAGLVLGFLTGGGKDREEREYDDEEALGAAAASRGRSGRGGRQVAMLSTGAEYEGEWKSRAREWEDRARELMKTCTRQEAEIRQLRSSSRREQRFERHGGYYEHYDREVPEERGGGWRDAVTAGVSGMVSSLLRPLRGGSGSGEYVVELESTEAHDSPSYGYGPGGQASRGGYGPQYGRPGYAQGQGYGSYGGQGSEGRQGYEGEGQQEYGQGFGSDEGIQPV